MPLVTLRAVLQDDVVARAAVEHISAAVAQQHVVVVAADEGVGARAAEQDVVAGAAVGGELNRPGAEGRGVDDVVAGEALDGHPVIGGLERR